MPKWLQFVADHEIILWLVVVCGVCNVLTSTVFHARMVSGLHGLIESRWFQEQLDRMPFTRPLLSRSVSMSVSTWARIGGVLQGVTLIVVGVAGLVLL
jgi:hypothetical protein